MTDRTITRMMLMASLIGFCLFGWVLFTYDLLRGIIG